MKIKYYTFQLRDCSNTDKPILTVMNFLESELIINQLLHKVKLEGNFSQMQTQHKIYYYLNSHSHYFKILVIIG